HQQNLLWRKFLKQFLLKSLVKHKTVSSLGTSLPWFNQDKCSNIFIMAQFWISEFRDNINHPPSTLCTSIFKKS
ncbi:MAG: hypothetical protein COZ08_08100, partial [Bacteroidetes bacterium CG_4_10_14_3_um_filter_42_6]